MNTSGTPDSTERIRNMFIVDFFERLAGNGYDQTGTVFKPSNSTKAVGSEF